MHEPPTHRAASARRDDAAFSHESLFPVADWSRELERLRARIDTDSHLARVGTEGLVVPSRDGAKMLKVATGYFRGGVLVADNLVEIRRSLIHQIVNRVVFCVSGKRDGNESFMLVHPGRDEINVRMVPLEAAYVDGPYSVGLMPLVEGRHPLSDTVVWRIFGCMQRLGVTVDPHQGNIIELPQRRFVVLETCPSLHPEILRLAAALDQHARSDVLFLVAVAHRLGLTSPYPAHERSMFQGTEPLSWKDVYTVAHHLGFESLRDIEGDLMVGAIRRLPNAVRNVLSRGALDPLEWDVHGASIMNAARRRFGSEFRPVPFNWSTGEGGQFYGIDRDTLEHYRAVLKDVQRPVDVLLAYAKAAERSPSRLLPIPRHELWSMQRAFIDSWGAKHAPA
jgi:hypothetical protein